MPTGKAAKNRKVESGFFCHFFAVEKIIRKLSTLEKWKLKVEETEFKFEYIELA